MDIFPHEWKFPEKEQAIWNSYVACIVMAVSKNSLSDWISTVVVSPDSGAVIWYVMEYFSAALDSPDFERALASSHVTRIVPDQII